MKIQGLTISSALGNIRAEYLLEAEEAYFEAVTKKRRDARNGWLARFVNSGWGVAIICALVAVSVMGGIIWAGFNAGDLPAGRPGEIKGEVYLTAGTQVIEPEFFFGHSEVHKGNQYSIACGSGFYGEFTVSPIPTLTYADDLRLHMPRNYTLDAVLVYSTEPLTEALYTFESVDDLKSLTAGSYYVALRITNVEGKNKYCNDYAFCLTVAPEVELPLMKQPHEWPVFDPPASAFLGKITGTYPDGGSVANIPLTAAYTQVQMPEGMAWYVMTARYAQAANTRGLLLLLYDPQSPSDAPYIALERQLQLIYPPVRTLLQLEDGRIVTLHVEEDIPHNGKSLEITANTWIWSKVDPDTGEELEEFQLLSIGEAWSYTFDLTDQPVAMEGWEYAFASYIYGLTDGETPTLRVLLDNLFCETNEIKYDLAQYEHFSEEETLTVGWARLQRIMDGELRPDLWVQPETLDLNFCDFALGHRLHVSFDPDGSLCIVFGSSEGIQSIYRGTYVIQGGFITIDCPVESNYFGFSLHGTHAFEQNGSSIKIGELTVTATDTDSTCPAVFIPLIMEFFHELNASADEYRQVSPESYAVMDMDGDGRDEIVVQLTWDGKDASYKSYVFFLDPVTEKIADYTTISYSYLYEDGSFSYTFDRTGSSYGADKLVAAGKGYTTRTLWRICNDGSENAEYYVGDEQVTKEALDAYIAEIECGKVAWMGCPWKITEVETDFCEENDDGKG